MKYRIIILLICFIGLATLSWSLFKVAHEKRILKEDLIELSNIKYGLFNVDEWKQIVSRIVIKKIEAFNLNESNRATMRSKISKLLYQMVDDLEKSNQKKKSSGIMGFIQGNVASLTGTFGLMKNEVPKFTEDIIGFMDDPENRKTVQQFILNKVNEYADGTFSKTDYALHHEIIAKHNFGNRIEAIKGLNASINTLNNQNRVNRNALFLLIAIVALFIVISKSFHKNEYLILTLISLILLTMGVILPMLEIDARISNMSFMLLGESVSFQDQVLYFKSKSILEVVQLMITQDKMDMLLVGGLVFLFSVLFPLSKLISSVFYIYSSRLKSNRFIQFIVFKTGKWSMADVMVITIFMAYLGFGGILSEQLAQLDRITPSIEILTTNKSSLLTGFYLFTAFAVLSLLTSHKLQYDHSK